MRAQLTALEKRLSATRRTRCSRSTTRCAYAFERDGGWDVEFERNRVANGHSDTGQPARTAVFNAVRAARDGASTSRRLILEDT
jgi:hypothetical protein